MRKPESWKLSVERLKLRVERVQRDVDLDTVAILTVLSESELRGVITNATALDERKLAGELVALLCDAAKQQRCSWQRQYLLTVVRHCDHAIAAFDYSAAEAEAEAEADTEVAS